MLVVAGRRVMTSQRGVDVVLAGVVCRDVVIVCVGRVADPCSVAIFLTSATLHHGFALPTVSSRGDVSCTLTTRPEDLKQ